MTCKHWECNESDLYQNSYYCFFGQHNTKTVYNNNEYYRYILPQHFHFQVFKLLSRHCSSESGQKGHHNTGLLFLFCFRFTFIQIETKEDLETPYVSFVNIWECEIFRGTYMYSPYTQHSACDSLTYSLHLPVFLPLCCRH